MKLIVALLLTVATVGPVYGAAVKGRLSASRPSQPFYATKGAALVQSQQQEQSQEQEAALPAFVEPPAAPAPEPDAGEPMMPYSFEYTANGEDGTGSARRESNDGQRVTGTYTLSGADGVSRVVHYVADKDGYRATIITNEPGTESQSPAATVLQSSQLPAEQIALQYGPREPAVPATSARLLAPQSSGVKGAPLRQGAVKAPIVQAPIVQIRAAPVKARLLPPPPPPPAAPVSSPRAPSKTRVTLPPPPPPPPAPAQIRSKTAPLRVQGKTGAIKGSRQPFYAATTTTTTTTTTAAPTTEEVQQQQAALLLDEQQQQQEEQQEFAQLQQEPAQQQQQEEQELSQEVDLPQQQQQSAFFSS